MVAWIVGSWSRPAKLTRERGAFCCRLQEVSAITPPRSYHQATAVLWLRLDETVSRHSHLWASHYSQSAYQPQLLSCRPAHHQDLARSDPPEMHRSSARKDVISPPPAPWYGEMDESLQAESSSRRSSPDRSDTRSAFCKPLRYQWSNETLRTSSLSVFLLHKLHGIPNVSESYLATIENRP